MGDNVSLSRAELYEKVENLLMERVASSSDVKSKNHKFHAENQFILGQFFYESVKKI